MDSGVSESDIPDNLMAKLIRSWLLLSKQDGVELKAATKGIKEPLVDGSGASNDDAKKGKGDKDKKEDKNIQKAPNMLKKPNAPVKPVHAAKPAEGRPESAPLDTKKRSKLRDRTGKEKNVTSIGDEPVDGPDVYYYLKDLENPGILTCLVEECGIPISAIFRVEDVAGSSHKRNNHHDTKNQNWEYIRHYAQKAADNSLWKDVAWGSFLANEYQGTKEIFELMAKKVYTILKNRKEYEKFYSADTPLVIPTAKDGLKEFRYYDYLSDIASQNGVQAVEVQTGLLLEYISRSGHDENEDEAIDGPESFKTFEDYGNVQMMFNNALLKLAINDVNSESGSTLKLKSLINKTIDVIPFHDKLSLLEKQLGHFETVGIRAGDLVSETSAHSQENKLASFTRDLPEYKNLDKSSYEVNSVKLKSELEKSIGTSFGNEPSIEHALLQMQFEFMFPENQGLGSAEQPFGAYSWKEILDQKALVQAIQQAKSTKPSINYKLSAQEGALLVTLNSPGPLGCLDHDETTEINVRTKVGFSLFNDILETETNSLAQSNDKRAACYSVGDRLIHMIHKTKYLYPADGFIFDILNDSANLISRTKISWNDNTITTVHPLSTQGPYASFNFNDQSTFCIKSGKAGNSIVSFSTPDGIHYNFLSNNKLSASKVGKIASQDSNYELSRLNMPSGVVIRYLEDENVQK